MRKKTKSRKAERIWCFYVFPQTEIAEKGNQVSYLLVFNVLGMLISCLFCFYSFIFSKLSQARIFW